MSSSLTSTNINSTYLYLILLVLVVVAAYYFLMFRQPSAVDNLNRQAFQLNYSAFKNAIQLAHYKFKTAQATKSYAQNRQSENDKELDTTQPIQSPYRNVSGIWRQQDNQLIYNFVGYPIGTNITNTRQTMPITSQDCLAIWQFILSVLQPKISTTKQADHYWVNINDDSSCTYQSSNIDDLVIKYDSKYGKVSLISR
jgi:type II secretory pathway pseudopilin PulG